MLSLIRIIIQYVLIYIACFSKNINSLQFTKENMYYIALDVHYPRVLYHCKILLPPLTELQEYITKNAMKRRTRFQSFRSVIAADHCCTIKTLQRKNQSNMTIYLKKKQILKNFKANNYPKTINRELFLVQ